jgi:F-type H+-transporting ATPase subunit delta
LFELAEERAALDDVAKDLADLRKMMGASPDLNVLLKSPLFKRAELERTVAAFAAKAGLGTIVTNLLGVLARARRLFALDAVISAYLARLAAKRGEITAQISSAQPLSDAQIGQIVALLKKSVGSDVALDKKIDPSLIGGLVVKIGSRMIDGSLKTKLQRMKLAMKGIG